MLHPTNGYIWANTYDKPFEYLCKNGTAISQIHSVHDNHHEDRIFAFQCRVTEIQQHTLCNWSRKFYVQFKIKSEKYKQTGITSLKQD